MVTSWWDEVHWKLWRIADRPELRPLIQSTRQIAREIISPLLAEGIRSTHEWTSEKAKILSALDEAGLTSIVSATGRDTTLSLALTIWELACIDGGAATCSMSGSLAQIPIRDFGTEDQRKQFLGNSELRHGALCLTEPLPGAGTDAMFLTGSFWLADGAPGSEPMLHIIKRGRFTSHMDFADYVVAAVQGTGDHARGSCLIILKPEDEGEFDRGQPVHKLGHQIASTTNPSFTLRIPASRIIGGYSIVDGTLAPSIDHRQALEPAFRSTRALLSIMTAAKLLSTVEPLTRLRMENGTEFLLELVDTWAIGEAAASLGFSAVRLCDSLNNCEQQMDVRRTDAQILSSAAKLFSSSQIPRLLQHLTSLGSWPVECGDLYEKLMDSQVEAVYLGSEALQRRQLSASMISARFLSEFEEWIEEVERHALNRPRAGIDCLAAGMKLWLWTLKQLREQTDSRGIRLYSDARQGVTFAMADALCWLLAARSLTLDVLGLETVRNKTISHTSLLFDLSTIASVRAAEAVAQTCADLLLGYADRFPVSSVTGNTFDALRTTLNLNVCGTATTRDRVVRFLSGNQES
jgi:alkylation response protein AidB-like acyl-CoA dehydrogenase